MLKSKKLALAFLAGVLLVFATPGIGSARGWHGGHGYGWGGGGWGWGGGGWGWGGGYRYGYSPYYNYGGYGWGYSPWSSYYYPSLSYGGYYGSYYYPYFYGYSNYYPTTPYYSSYYTYPYSYSYATTTPTDSYYYGNTTTDNLTRKQNTVLLDVHVPFSNAQVWINDAKTQQQGTERRFISPPLDLGHKYTYDIRARWYDNGQEVNRTRSISVSPNQNFDVDFTRVERPSTSSSQPLSTSTSSQPPSSNK